MKKHILSLLIFLAAISGQAEVIFQISLTGEDILNNPAVSFPNDPGTLSGTSVLFDDPADSEFDKLFVLPLISAGTLNQNDNVRITIDSNITRVGTDSDKPFAISDGVNIVGALPADNSGGSAFVVDGVDSSTTSIPNNIPQVFNNSGIPNEGQTLDLQVILTLEQTQNVSISFLGSSGNLDVTNFLDPSRALSFVFGSGPGERSQLNTLDITIEKLNAVPELNSMILLGLAALLIRKRL